VTASGDGASGARPGPGWRSLAGGGATGLLAIVMALGGEATAWGQGDEVRLHAAGSLRAALTEVARAFTAAHGVPVTLVFGASGLLRERLERGEPGDVFASANMDHPQALAQAGKAGRVVMFARNQLCALTRPEVGVTSDTLLDRMLDPAVTLGPRRPGRIRRATTPGRSSGAPKGSGPGARLDSRRRRASSSGAPPRPRRRRTGASTPSS
jgi:hypothetical protein